MKAPMEEKATPSGNSNNNNNSNCSFIKTSLSMTSLPPDGQQDSSDVIKAKLRVERPYNSLKKKRNPERDLWRHSWGSGNSHSSCSLHSSVNGAGLNCGKDDFWAALQTNYNYIMDTNLLDTCREARCEIEGAASASTSTPDCCSKMLESNRSEGSAEDPRELRKWLREMEQKISIAPSLFEARQMSGAELQRRLNEHSVLYCEIVSHARVVSACVRASEKEIDQSNTNSISTGDKTPSPNGKKFDGNLKGLERRYHLLYLQAIEVQCMFEGLLGKKNSSSVLSRASSTETDDEPASKLARLSDSESNTHASCGLLSRDQTSDENKSEGELEEGEDWPDIAFNAVFVADVFQANVEFDADSEGSDGEDDIKESSRQSLNKKDKGNRSNKSKDDSVLSENMDSTSYNSGSVVDFKVSEKKLQNSNQNLNRTPPKTGSLSKKRQRTIDISKFNRSNRKSKNCAIFYFKHLDTDNENFGISSQGSDAIKSGDPSSDDEGWLYTNECIDGLNPLNDDSDKENKEVAANLGEIQKSTTNVSIIERNTKEAGGIDLTICNETVNEEREHPIRSGLNHLKGEIHMESVSTEISGDIDNKNKNPPESKAEMVGISKKENSHESIKQLVLDAENLIRDEVLKTPRKIHSLVKISTNKKRETNMPGSNNQWVQEWLEHQPIGQKDDCVIPLSTTTTDCEASGEYTESDSAARESDTSEGFTDSVATCMQTGSTSQCTSTEKIGGSVEPIASVCSNPSLTSGKVIRRTNRRNSDRPWSVSCLSQLTENTTINADKVNNNQGLATHSISESALHILSSPGRRKVSPQTPVKNSDSKNSLKRRKTRRRKAVSKKSDSGSDGFLPKLTQSIMQTDSISGQINIINDLTTALSMISLPKTKKPGDKSPSEMESEDEQALMKPNFKLGSYTSAYMTNESKLGSLAALANYMNEEQGVQAATLKVGKEYNTGTEDHSSFSEQAWDNYQEKYNSENYSEGFDSDAARRLLEFGDDYRNFLDSQSDCCSSLSAANNLDSLSPPRMDSLKQNEPKLTQQAITSTVDHARRRRALELEYERRRKSSELRKKSSQDDVHNLRSPTNSSCTLNPLTPKCGEKSFNRTAGDSSRKLDFGMNTSAQSLRKTSESDTSLRRRKSEDALTVRRRSSRTLDKSFKVIPSTSSSSNYDTDEEKEVKSLLSQSRNRLENTNALKIRSHLLRPEDYTEIIDTCRENIRCLESVLRGPPATVLSNARSHETRDLLSSWETLLAWSENAGAARKMQEEMVVLKNAFNRLGRQICDYDSESSIQLMIEELKNERTKLQTYRTSMLRLNGSVHSWLTRQELKLKEELEALSNEAENNNASQEKGLQLNTIVQSENEFHKHLKDEVSEMYSAWNEANSRINNHLEMLDLKLTAWRQLEYGLSEFHQILGKDRGTLKGLEGALNKGQATPVELAQNVKLVARLLSEKIDNNQQQATTTQDIVDPGRLLPMPIAQFTSSNGSLSDSGISDGGATSDGGLSERERRLTVLRRLAKQLESDLAPGSEALKSITARMESAEAELKTLQNTCRELIVRTAVSQQKKSQTAVVSYNAQIQQRIKKSPPSKRKNKRKIIQNAAASVLLRNQKKISERQLLSAPDSGDPDDPKDFVCVTSDDDDLKGGWVKRIAKFALPMQVALIALFCAACLMEPHCCDSLNNLSMSFSPQLRYVRGPPPI